MNYTINKYTKTKVYLYFSNKNTINDNLYKLILIKYDSVLKINNTNIFIPSQTLICLNEQENLTAKTKLNKLCFSPTVLNKNLTYDVIKREDYSDVADAHLFFRLIYFIKRDNIYNCTVPLNYYMYRKIQTNLTKIKYQIDNQPTMFWTCRARSYMIDILLLLEKTSNIYTNDINENNIETDKINLLLDYIHGNFNKNININKLCSIIDIPKNHFSHFFFDIFGCSYTDYIRDLRISIASHYLAFTELSLSEIAFRIGFSDQSYFTRVFTKEKGVPPNTYRKQAVNARKTYFHNI